MTDREVLTGCPSWSATPWDYSSMRYVQFQDDGTGVAIYGYGQTIFAQIQLRFELLDDSRLRFDYLTSPPFQRFGGFSPTDANGAKTLEYTRTDDPRQIRESITGGKFRFGWRLVLSGSPYPKGLDFPHEVPREFFGYRERVEE